MAGRGEARYRLTLDQTDFQKGIASATEQLQKFGQTMLAGVGIGAGFDIGAKAAEGLIGAIKGIPEAALAAVEHLEEVSHAIEGIQAKTGLGTAAAQELGTAMRIAGGDSEALAGLITKLQKNIVSGTGAFAAMGLSAKKLKSEDIGTAFTEVAERIQSIKNPTEQTAAMLAVFGKSGSEAARLIKSGVKELSEDAHHLGAVLGGETVEAAGRLGQESRRLDIAWESLKNNLAATIVEDQDVQDVLHGIAEAVAAASRAARDGKPELSALLDVFKDLAKISTKGLFEGLTGIDPEALAQLAKSAAGKSNVSPGDMLGAAARTGAGFLLDNTVGAGWGGILDAAHGRAAGAIAPHPFVGPMPDSGYDPTGQAASEKKAFAELDAQLSAVQAKHNGVYAGMIAQQQASIAKRIAEADASKRFTAEGLVVEEQKIRALGAAEMELAKHEFMKQALGPDLHDKTNQIKDLYAAIQIAGGTAQLSDDQLTKAIGTIKGLGDAGLASATGIAVMNEALARSEQLALKAAPLRNLGDLGATMRNDWDRSLAGQLSGVGTPGAIGVRPQIMGGNVLFDTQDHGETDAEAKKKVMQAEAWAAAIKDVQASLKSMADYFGKSWIGTIAGAGAAAIGVFDGLKEHEKMAAQDGGMTTGQKVTAGAQAAQGALAIWQSEQYNRSGASGAMHGAEAGAAAGAQFGPAGVVIGAIAGGVIGFFAGSKFREVCKQAGTTLGGVVSDELAKAIMQTSKDQHLSTANASLLHISDFVGEDKTGTHGISTMGPQLQQLLAGIAQGTIPARAGMEELNKDFGELATAAAGGDVAAQKLTSDLLQQAMAAGKLTDSMKQYIADAMTGMASGADLILKGIADIGQKVPLGSFGVAAAQMFVGGFEAEIAQKGLVQALEDDGAGIVNLYQRLVDEGNGAAAAMLAPWVDLSNVINNQADPSVKGFLEALQGMSQVFTGLDKLGFVTGDSFQALETGAEGAFNALTEGGASSKEALQAIAPELAQIIAAHEKYGIAIDEGTQKLIDQAKQAGVSFPTDPVQAMIGAVHDLIDAIREMNGLPPRDWGAGPPGAPPSDWAPPPDAPPEGPPMGTGGYVPPRAGGVWKRLAEAGQGEYVVPENRVQSFASAALDRRGDDMASMAAAAAASASRQDSRPIIVQVTLDGRVLAEQRVASMQQDQGGERTLVAEIARRAAMRR